MIEELVDVLCLDLKLVLIGIGVSIGLTNALKKFGKLKGYANLIPVGLCALILAFLFGIPDPMSVLAYLFAIFVGAVISWETSKTLMHKAGPKTKE